MKTKRIVSIIVILAFLMTVFTGCGAKETSSQNTEETNNSVANKKMRSKYVQTYFIYAERGAVVTWFDPKTGEFKYKRKCEICGKVFVIKTLDSVYCSPKCSKVASKRKKDKEKKEALFAAYAQTVPDIREYLTAKQVVAIYGIERSTLYRLVRFGKIPSINLGVRLTRFKRSEMDKLFHYRRDLKFAKEVTKKKLYSLEPEDCYTIGEVCEKYHLDDSSVWAHVRKYSIPSRQIGNYVYVPKEEIDKLYKSEQ